MHGDGQHLRSCPFFEAVCLSLTEGTGLWGGQRGRGLTAALSPQLPDERHAVPEARVAQRPPCQGPEVQTPPQVPAAAAELHGPQEMEGKDTILASLLPRGKSAQGRQSHSLLLWGGSLVPTGFLVVSVVKFIFTCK